MNKNDGFEFEIDLQKLLFAYLQKWWLILVCGVVAAVLTLGCTKLLVTPMYQASVTVYVNNTRSGEQIDYLSSANLTAAKQLVNTYISMIRSDTVLEKVSETSGLDMSAGDIREVMTAVQVPNTELFKVVITHPDPQTAADIANAVAAVAPKEIENFVEGSSAKIIDYAKVPDRASSPNVLRNTALGALVGLLLCVGYLTLQVLFDVRIKDDEDLNALFDLPVLGQIPDFNTISAGKNKGYGYGKSGYATSATENEKGGAASGK